MKINYNRTASSSKLLYQQIRWFNMHQLTFAQETAITILAPALAIPPASDFEPTYQMMKMSFIIHKIFC